MFYQGISDWVLRDISYYNYGEDKLVVFVSLGGTCRCVMAKAIFASRLADAKIGGVSVEAAAIGDPAYSRISPSAIAVLDEIDCRKYIAQHRPRKLSSYLQKRADRAARQQIERIIDAYFVKILDAAGARPVI